MLLPSTFDLPDRYQDERRGRDFDTCQVLELLYLP
jgi:hypothetical protein